MTEFILLMIIGYLIGSLSPGYLFGRIIKRIDIRKFGLHNTGATNTYRIVGPVYGFITVIFDFFKAPLVYYAGISILHSPDLTIIVGLAAVVGHVAPFYLGFRGGRGVASLFGLGIAALIFTQSIYSLLLVVSTITYTIVISEQIKIKAPARAMLKLGGIIFPLGLLWFPTNSILWIVGTLLFISLIFDAVRFIYPNFNRRYLKKHAFAKQKELKRISGYTLFLISTFLVIMFFPKEIAMLSLIFFILGDLVAPLSRVTPFLPQNIIFGDKTLGGFITIFAISSVAGIFLQSLTSFSFSVMMVILAASLTATFDQLSFIVDDNLLVPIGTALVLMLLT